MHEVWLFYRHFIFIPISLSNPTIESIFSKALLYIPRPLESRKYFIDLTPKILFAKSDMLPILLKSRVNKYLEFKPLTGFHTYENDNFEKVPGSKEDIFTDQTLSLLTKRSLMRFMKFVLEYEESPELWGPYTSRPITDFLKDKFKIEPQQANELIYSIGLCTNSDIPTIDALTRMKRYIVSLGVYGSFPALYVMYGSAGELVQGFSRSAAVAGATFKLNTSVASYDKSTKIAILADGGRIQVNESIVLSAQSALKIPNVTQQNSVKKSEVTRMVAIVAKDCKEWFAENEQAAVISFPPGSLPSNNKHAVQAIIMGGGSGMCPNGQSIWYLSSTEKGTKARTDLEGALNKLEASILRESTTDFEFADVGVSDVSVRPDGMPVLSSVKLGQSLQNFVPKEKLQYLLKLCYTQATSHLEAINSDKEGQDQEFHIVPPPSAEITFDGIVTNAKQLYEQIIGSDDDFFDIDFEDDEDEDDLDSGATVQNASHPGAQTTTGTHDRIDDDHFDDDDRAPEFGDDMEL